MRVLFLSNVDAKLIQAFVTSLMQNPHQTYQELLRSLRLILHPRFTQKPQLGSSHHIVCLFEIDIFGMSRLIDC